MNSFQHLSKWSRFSSTSLSIRLIYFYYTHRYLQSDGLEPELGNAAIAFNMSVRRLVAVARVKEESIGGRCADK